jgi:hypothetical protein
MKRPSSGTTHVGSIRCEYNVLPSIDYKLMQAHMLLIISILPYANQTAIARWQSHLILDWHVPIDYWICTTRTASSVDNPLVYASLSRHWCHTMGRSYFQSVSTRNIDVIKLHIPLPCSRFASNHTKENTYKVDSVVLRDKRKIGHI